MIDVTTHEKKNRMNANALATIFAMCMVNEQREISDKSSNSESNSASLAMAMVRTREHQFAVRDFLVKCMELRVKKKKKYGFFSSSKEEDSDGTDTDSDVDVIYKTPVKKEEEKQRDTPKRMNIPSQNIDNEELRNKIAAVPVVTVTMPTTPKTPSPLPTTTSHQYVKRKTMKNVSPASLKTRFVKRGDPEWVKDDAVKACTGCGAGFTMMLRKHHCRFCGRIYCKNCAPKQKQVDESRRRRICATCRSVTPCNDEENNSASISDLILTVADSLTPSNSKSNSSKDLSRSNSSLLRFDGNLDESTVMALQRFLNSTTDDNAVVDVNGEFEYDENTRYAFNKETNKALHEFLGVCPVELETTKKLILALQQYLNRRASWVRAGRHSSLKTVASSDLIHWDMTSEDFGPGFTNALGRSDINVEMKPLTKEQMEGDRQKILLDLVYGLRHMNMEGKEEDIDTHSRRESGGFPLSDADTFAGRLRDGFDRYQSFMDKVKKDAEKRDEELEKEKKKSSMLWEKLRNTQIADEQREAKKVLEIGEIRDAHETYLERLATASEREMLLLRKEMMSKQEMSLAKEREVAKSELQSALDKMRVEHALNLRETEMSMQSKFHNEHTATLSQHVHELKIVRQEHEHAIRENTKTYSEYQEQSEKERKRVREEHEKILKTERDKLQVETHSLKAVHIYEIESAERDAEMKLAMSHENDMKMAKMEHLRAMGMLREQHASQLMEIQKELDSTAGDDATSMGKKKKSGWKFWG